MLNDINWDCLNDDVPEPKLKVSTAVPKVTTPLPTLKSPSVIENISNVKQLDIEEASRLLPYDQIDCFKKQTDGFEVVTFNECETALSMALQSRKLSKAVESKRKEITKPHLDFQKGIKKIADAFIDELKSIESSLTQKVEVFNEARKKKSNEIGVDLTTVESVHEGVTYDQEVWDFETTNLDEVPKNYFKLDERAVRKAIFDGDRSIPGLSIFKKTIKRYRVN
jgi:hypothetical protein